MKTWQVTEDNLVDDTLTIEVILEGDIMQFYSVLFLLVEEVETWSVTEDKFVNDSLVFVVITDGDVMHFCSIL